MLREKPRQNPEPVRKKPLRLSTWSRVGGGVAINTPNKLFGKHMEVREREKERERYGKGGEREFGRKRETESETERESEK